MEVSSTIIMCLEVWIVKDKLFLKSYAFTETLYFRILHTDKNEQYDYISTLRMSLHQIQYRFLLTQTIISYEYLSRLDLYLTHRL